MKRNVDASRRQALSDKVMRRRQARVLSIHPTRLPEDKEVAHPR